MKIGDQIAYIPMHADGDINHPDVEFGFITGFNSAGDPFCRYWRKGQIGALRTTANSECTPIDMVRHYPSVSQAKVDGFIRKHYANDS